MRREAKDKELDYKEKSKQQLVDEKIALQSTISVLTDEIEALSVKNEEFLACVHNKDFYHEYQQTKDELRTLKNAHALLINMIRDDDLAVQTSINTKDPRLEKSEDLIKDTSFILGTDVTKITRKRQTQDIGPLQEIDLNKPRHAGLSSLLSCNAFGGMLKDGRYAEQEINLKSDSNIKINAEFLSNRLENVDINFLKHKSP